MNHSLKCQILFAIYETSVYLRHIYVFIKHMNSPNRNEDKNKPEISTELQNKAAVLQRKLALLRQRKVGGIINGVQSSIPVTIPDFPTLTLEDVSEKVVENKPPQVPTETVQQPPKSLDTIMRELQSIERTIDKAIPTFSQLPQEIKRDIMTDITKQERDWERLRPQDVNIRKEETRMWGGFMGTAKENDFIEVLELNTLENGEIANLVANGFESFQIVKIRTKNKDIYTKNKATGVTTGAVYVMSAVKYVIKNPAGGEGMP